jgi:amidase
MARGRETIGELVERGAAHVDAYRAACEARRVALDASVRAFACAPEGRSAPAAGGGPLAGVPVAIKDLIDTADLPTAYGSPIFAGHRPERDAIVVARLRAAGAVIAGKTVTTEFAWLNPGPTRNPWNLGHTPGGSSSGSAAAVASGFVPLALGTQTAGSVIRPAAFCGVVGFKPSFGAIARTGVRVLAESLDHVGLFARLVDDVALGYAAIAGPDRSDPHGWAQALPLVGLESSPAGLADRPPTIGVPSFERLAQASPAARQALDEACDRLEAAGARILRIGWPKGLDAYDDLLAQAMTMAAAEVHGNFARIVAENPERTSDALKAIVAKGRALSLDDYLAARHAQQRARRAFDAVLDGLDLLLTLPAAGEAPEGLGSTGDPSFCVPWTFIGAPALTFPAKLGPGAMPLGVQLIGRPADDLAFLRHARWCAVAAQMPADIEPPLGEAASAP